MSTNIDSLNIQIMTSAGSASANIDKLTASLKALGSVGSVTKATNALKRLAETLNQTKASFANIDGIRKLGATLKSLEGIQKLSNLNSAINTLKKLPEISKQLNTAEIEYFAANMKKLSDALGPLTTRITAMSVAFKSFPKNIGKTVTATNRLTDSTEHLSHGVNTSNLNIMTAISNLQNYVSAIQWVQNTVAGFISTAIEWDGIQFRFGRAFGEDAEEVYRYVQKVSDALMIGEQQFMQYSSLYGSLLSGFGMAQEQVTTISVGLTELSYDIWAAYNDRYKTLEAASEAVRSAITGEIEPIRNAGIALTEASLQEYLDSVGMATTNIETLSEAQKAEVRYAAMMNAALNQGIVGTYAKEMHTAEGAVRTLTQQIKVLWQAIGSLFIPILQAVVPWVTAFVRVLYDAAAAIAQFFGIPFFEIDWSNTSKGIGGVADSADGAGEALGDAAKAAKKLRDYTLGFDELNVIDPTTSSASGGAGSEGVGGSLGLDLDTLWDESIFSSASKKVDELKAKFEPVIEWLKENFNTILDVVVAIGAGLLAWKISTSTQGLIDAIKNGGFNKVGMGITLAVTGFVLEFKGAYDLGYEGATLENVLKTAIGAALGIGGSLLIFGTGPLGWTVGIGLALTLLVTGITMGSRDRKLDEELAERFGEVVLDEDQIDGLVKKVLTFDWTEKVQAHVGLVADLESLRKSIEKDIEEMNKYGWKVQTGLELTRSEMSSYKASIESFIESANKFVTDHAYAVEVGITATLDPGATRTAILESNAKISELVSGELAALGTRLQNYLNEAFSDGVLTLKEQEVVANLTAQITRIIEIMNEAEIKAELDVINLKYGGAQMTPETWEAYYEDLRKTADNMKVAAEETVNETLKGLHANVAIARMEFEKDPLNAEAVKMLHEAEKALREYNDANPLQVMYDDIDARVGGHVHQTLINTYGDVLDKTKPGLSQAVEDLFVNGTTMALPEEAYNNLENLVTGVREGIVAAIGEAGIDYETSKTLNEQLEKIAPNLDSYKKAVDTAVQTGEGISQGVVDGLTNIYTWKAASANLEEQAEGVMFLTGQKLTNSPEFFDLLQQADNFGFFLNEELAYGIHSNTKFVEDAATGTMGVFQNGIEVARLEITPDLVKNMNALGVDISSGVIAGAESGMQADKKSWLEWSIWPWNWFQKKNEIHSPSKLFERGGKYLGQGLLNGVRSSWDDIVKWYKTNIAPKFTLAFWVDKFSALGSGFTTTIKTMLNIGIAKINQFIGWLNDQLSFSWEAQKIMGKEVIPAGSITLFTIPMITQRFADGGFIEDGLFTMNHGEIAGRFSNGKSVVANNEQIIAGISEGVYRAVVAAMSEGSSGGDQNVNVYLDGKQIYASVKKTEAERGRNIMGNQLGYSY